MVSYETIRRWAKKFGPDYVVACAASRPPNDVWHLDEVVITIAGKKHWLWRAVDQDGYVLERSSRHAAIPRPPSDCDHGC